MNEKKQVYFRGEPHHLSPSKVLVGEDRLRKLKADREALLEALQAVADWLDRYCPDREAAREVRAVVAGALAQADGEEARQ